MIALSVLVVSLLVFLAVLILIMLKSYRKGKTTDYYDFGSLPESDKKTDCPLCGESLKKGERVHSLLFPGEDDGIMHIYGCPYCFTGHPLRANRPVNNRTCPSCHSVLEEKDYVYARVFKKPNKTHVSIVGCTVCRGIRP